MAGFQPGHFEEAPRPLQGLPLVLEERQDGRLEVVVLFVVGHGQVEDGQVDGVRPLDVKPDQALFGGLGAEGAREPVEPVPHEQRRDVVGPDALLVEPLQAAVALQHLPVPVAGFAAVAVPEKTGHAA